MVVQELWWSTSVFSLPLSVCLFLPPFLPFHTSLFLFVVASDRPLSPATLPSSTVFWKIPRHHWPGERPFSDCAAKRRQKKSPPSLSTVDSMVSVAQMQLGVEWVRHFLVWGRQRHYASTQNAWCWMESSQKPSLNQAQLCMSHTLEDWEHSQGTFPPHSRPSMTLTNRFLQWDTA